MVPYLIFVGVLLGVGGLIEWAISRKNGPSYRSSDYDDPMGDWDR